MASLFIHGSLVLYTLTHSLLQMPETSITVMPPVNIELVSAQNLQTPEQRPAEPIAAAADNGAAGVLPEDAAPRPQDREPTSRPGSVVPDRSSGERAPLDDGADPAPGSGEALPAKTDAASQTGLSQDEIFLEPPPEYVPDRAAETGAPESGGDKGSHSPAKAERAGRASPSSSGKKSLVAHHRRRARHGGVTASVAPVRTQHYARSAGNSASRLYALAYRRKVLAHLAANRPSGGMGRGTVAIAFSLSRSGRLLSAHISQSSGRPALDRAALASVRGASPFPPPPTRLQATRYRFVFPFYFQ